MLGSTVIIPARHGTQRSRVLVAVLPVFVALTLLYGAYFTDSGLGAGEKDVLIAVPALIWSVLFAAILWALTCRWPLTRSLLPAAGLSLLLVVVLAYLFLWFAGRGSQHSNNPSSFRQPFSVLTRTAAASANLYYPSPSMRDYHRSSPCERSPTRRSTRRICLRFATANPRLSSGVGRRSGTGADGSVEVALGGLDLGGPGTVPQTEAIEDSRPLGVDFPRLVGCICRPVQSTTLRYWAMLDADGQRPCAGDAGDGLKLIAAAA